MKTLKVTLKQHTPLIHFQHDQYGATLRASEVKPKLDRFILTKLGNGDYDQGCDLARTNKWLIGEKNALNYKISIVPYERKDVSLRISENKGKFETEVFPMILSNMGGKENREELMNLSLYNYVVATIITNQDSILEELRHNLPLFFATTNFGQRQTKGFGSFTVYKFNEEKPIGWNPSDYYVQGCPYMAFALGNGNNLNDKQQQEKIFAVLDFYWKCLKAGVNYTRNGQHPGRYIKSFLYCFLNDFLGITWEKRKIKQQFNLGTPGTHVKENNNTAVFARGFLGCPDKYAYGNREVKVEHNTNDESLKIDRIPTPIYFKPILLGRVVYVYILFDSSITSNLVPILKENREFKMSYNGRTLKMDMRSFLNSKNYAVFIDEYHKYLSTDVDVAEALYSESSKETYVDYSDENLLDDDWGFVPRDFNWRDILKDRNCVIFNNVE